MKSIITFIIAGGSIYASHGLYSSGHLAASAVLNGITIAFVYVIGQSAGREEAGGEP